MNRKIGCTFLLGILPATFAVSDIDFKPRPQPRILSENQRLSGERKEDYAAQLSLEQVFGIIDQEYEKLSQLKEKSPHYYRKLLTQEYYAWFHHFGMKDSKIYKEGHWIYPYLVEGLTETDSWDKGIFYPPKMIDSGEILVHYSDVKVRLLHHVNRLYIQKNYDKFLNRSNFFFSYAEDETTMNSIVSTKNIKEIKKLQKKLITDYCLKFKTSKYCRSLKSAY